MPLIGSLHYVSNVLECGLQAFHALLSNTLKWGYDDFFLSLSFIV